MVDAACAGELHRSGCIALLLEFPYVTALVAARMTRPVVEPDHLDLQLATFQPISRPEHTRGDLQVATFRPFREDLQVRGSCIFRK